VPNSISSSRRCSLRLAVLFALTLLCGCSLLFGEDEPAVEEAAKTAAAPEPQAESAEEESDSSWYNSAIARPLFGDFDPIPTVKLSPQTIQELLPRGEYLATTVAACGSCHGANAVEDSPLIGGRVMQDRSGEVRAANITPDKATGIGTWNVGEIVRAIRSSIDSDGRPLSIDAHQAYRWMSDRDAKAIAVWLLRQQPKKHEVERRRLGGLERNSWLLWPEHSEVLGYIPQFVESKSAQYGLYLSHHVGQCAQCHTPGGVTDTDNLFSGDGGWYRGPFDDQDDKEWSERKNAERFAAAREDNTFPLKGGDIRGTSETGLKTWAQSDIIRYLKTGRAKDGTQIDPHFCPWSSYRDMSDSDLESIAMYLKGL
jgi:alcohol dehydrogenase (quinone), cytochrome c subunit